MSCSRTGSSWPACALPEALTRGLDFKGCRTGCKWPACNQAKAKKIGWRSAHNNLHIGSSQTKPEDADGNTVQGWHCCEAAVQLQQPRILEAGQRPSPGTKRLDLRERTTSLRSVASSMQLEQRQLGKRTGRNWPLFATMRTRNGHAAEVYMPQVFKQQLRGHDCLRWALLRGSC